MKLFYRIAYSLFIGLLLTNTAFAGNPDRIGQAGATELLINPWARSAGWNALNTASIKGVEALTNNCAGITHLANRTELQFSRTNWLVGTDIKINAFGYGQKIGEDNFIGVSVTSFDLGEFIRTTVDNPEGIGTFSPQLLNIGATYGRKFTQNIFGAMTLRVISESITDVSAIGVAVDAGIHYWTGKDSAFKFGVTLKNIGPAMQFRGNGLAVKTTLNTSTNATTYALTVSHRSQSFELPLQLMIGSSYDFRFGETFRTTVVANYTSNSFYYDQIGLGTELAYNEMFMLRAGFNYEKDIFNKEKRLNAHTGFAIGATVELPFGKEKKNSFGVDYSYRTTNPFGGTHAIGIRLNI